MIILLKLIYMFHGIWRAQRDSLSQVQIKDYSISPVITYNVEITLHKYEACWSRIDVVWRRCNVANLDKITTQFWHRDADGIEGHVYTCVFICRFYKGKQIFDFLCASLDDETFSKGSILKGKNPRWVMIFFFKNWLPLKRAVKTTIEVASL